VSLGAAAATVLERIERGERLWSRRARGAGLEALRAHRAGASGRKARDAMAARHCAATLWVRGVRALEARVKRRNVRREAAGAAATIASVFARACQMRAGLALLKRRNRQARTALRSRDDLADLHFAEWRVPCAVQGWKERARASRSYHHHHAIAASRWRTKALPIALATWVRHSLGDPDKRRRLFAMRDALSTPAPTLPRASGDPRFTRGSHAADRVGVELQKSEAGGRLQLRLSKGRGDSDRDAAESAPATRVAISPASMPQQPSLAPGLVSALPVRAAAGGTPTR
ncbi:unnamed protein product, partial [Hapterophycus canaliculatus]